MLAAGVRAVLTCVDPSVLPAEFSGRSFDQTLLAQLPDGVDPRGERGEFHTFAWDAPGFSSPIDIELGETVCRDGFVFHDVLATNRPALGFSPDAKIRVAKIDAERRAASAERRPPITYPTRR